MAHEMTQETLPALLWSAMSIVSIYTEGTVESEESDPNGARAAEVDPALNSMEMKESI